MRINHLFLVLTPLLLVGCSETAKPTESSKLTYYHVDSLLDAQVEYLGSQNAQLQKKNNTEEAAETALVKMDSTQWVSTLSIFRALDINNPSLKDAYTIRDQLKDSSSNLNILHYRLKKADNRQRLKELSFYYLGSIENLKKITAKTSFHSAIYNSSNLFELTFDQSQKQTVLRSYTISAAQKTMFRDSVKAIVNFEVSY